MHSYKSPRPPRTPRSPRSTASSPRPPPSPLSTASLPVDTGKASLFLYTEALQKQLVAAQHAAHVATQEADSLRKAYATAQQTLRQLQATVVQWERQLLRWAPSAVDPGEGRCHRWAALM